VALPWTVEQVQQIVRLANTEKVSVLPICGGSSTRSSNADILLDMMMMDKILKIDTENSYVLLGPGVTFAHLDRFFGS
jgi:FAD/FMN-containing dehydrogenase